MSVAASVALVTGGSSGIGRGISIALSRRGYRVLVVGHTRERVDETLRLLRRSSPNSSDSTHMGLALDVSKESDARDMVSRALDVFGRIDILVTSAGIGRQREAKRILPYPTHALPLQEWSEVIAVNLTGVFLTNRAVLPTMLNQREGHIINVCSSTTPYGLRGTPYAPAYCASKFGVVGFTESLAEEVESRGIRVQALFPGRSSRPWSRRPRWRGPSEAV